MIHTCSLLQAITSVFSLERDQGPTFEPVSAPFMSSSLLGSFVWMLSTPSPPP